MLEWCRADTTRASCHRGVPDKYKVTCWTPAARRVSQATKVTSAADGPPASWESWTSAIPSLSIEKERSLFLLLRDPDSKRSSLKSSFSPQIPRVTVCEQRSKSLQDLHIPSHCTLSMMLRLSHRRTRVRTASGMVPYRDMAYTFARLQLCVLAVPQDLSTR